MLSQAEITQAKSGLAEANAANEALRAELATAMTEIQAAGQSAEDAAAAKAEAEAQLKGAQQELAAAQMQVSKLSETSKVGCRV